MDGEPQQEPAFPLPFRKGDPKPLPVIRGDGPALGFGVFLQGGDQRFAPGAEVLLGDGKPHLGSLRRLPQGGQQVLQVLALPAQGGHFDEDFGHQVGAVIQKMVLPHGGMAAGLNGQGAVHPFLVQAQGLVDDVLVSPLKAVVFPAQGGFNVLLQPVGGDGVRDHSAAGMALQGNGGGQGHQPVAVDLLSPVVHCRAPVHVRVEDDAQVGVGGLYRLADGGHGLRIFRVGHMVGEHAVWL